MGAVGTGAAWTGSQIAQGAIAAGNATWAGTKWTGNQIAVGGKAAYEGINYAARETLRVDGKYWDYTPWGVAADVGTVIYGHPSQWFNARDITEKSVGKLLGELNSDKVSQDDYSGDRSQVNDNKYGHSNQMSELEKIYGILGTPFIAIGGVFYEIGTGVGFICGHVQGQGVGGFGNGDAFDGQHFLNWSYDTPGDLLGNVVGQVSGIIDMFSGGAIHSSWINKMTLLIPGPD